MNLFAIDLDAIGFIVLISATVKLSCFPYTIPLLPNATASTAIASLTTVITKSEDSATSFGVSTLVTPRLSSDSDSKEYPKYCQYSLLKYKPWIGRPPEYDWEASQHDSWGKYVIYLWEQFSNELNENNLPIPDLLRSGIDEYVKLRNTNDLVCDKELEYNDGRINESSDDDMDQDQDHNQDQE